MTLFQTKPLEPNKRVCLRLKECREAKGLTMAELALRTRISQKHLEALEQCRFSDIPYGAVYQKNFIKRVASALGADPEALLNQFLEEEATEEAAQSLAKVIRKKTSISNMPLLLRYVFLGAAVVIVVIYLGIQVKQSIEPPMLVLLSPQNGHVATTPKISVRGTTEKEAQISINGEPVIIDNEGKFEEQMYLSPGINTIVISAKKKRGKSATETRHVILKTAEELSFQRPG